MHPNKVFCIVHILLNVVMLQSYDFPANNPPLIGIYSTYYLEYSQKAVTFAQYNYPLHIYKPISSTDGK